MYECDRQFKIFTQVDTTKSYVILAHLIFCNRLVYGCFFIRLLFSSVDVVLKNDKYVLMF